MMNATMLKMRLPCRIRAEIRVLVIIFPEGRRYAEETKTPFFSDGIFYFNQVPS